MIISHKHKFIFLHCRKTGGSSIKCYLNKYIGPQDIQIGAWLDVIKNGGNFNKRVLLDTIEALTINPKSYYSMVKKVLGSCILGKCKYPIAKIFNNAHKFKYENIFKSAPHPMAYEVKQEFPREWDHYTTFCFVRNPFEKAVSEYLWRKRKRGITSVSFREFMERVADPLRKDPEDMAPIPSHRSNWSIYTIDDSVVVDFVGRYEKLNRDTKHIFKEIGIPFIEKKLPESKKSKSYNYKNFYDSRSLSLAKEIYSKEACKFGYTFE